MRELASLFVLILGIAIGCFVGLFGGIQLIYFIQPWLSLSSEQDIARLIFWLTVLGALIGLIAAVVVVCSIWKSVPKVIPDPGEASSDE